MKILAILGLLAALVTFYTPALAQEEAPFVPLDTYCQSVLPSDCSHTGDTPNHLSSLSSTSEGGVYTCTAQGEGEHCDDPPETD